MQRLLNQVPINNIIIITEDLSFDPAAKNLWEKIDQAQMGGGARVCVESLFVRQRGQPLTGPIRERQKRGLPGPRQGVRDFGGRIAS